MQPRLFKDPLKQEEKPSKNFTLEDHMNNLRDLIVYMEQSNIEPSSESDKKNAANQLAFAKKVYELLDKMLTTPNINTKKNIGIELGKLPKFYFGDKEVPIIEGNKSKVFAMLLASHYRELSYIKFSALEIDLSIIASKVPFLDVRSLPEQIEHNLKLAKKIEQLVEEHTNPRPATLTKK